MPKIINNCAQCAYMGLYYCNHPSRDKSIYAHKERLPSTGIPDDCPLEDAPDIDRLNEEIGRLRDQSQGYKNGQLQMQDICDALYDANMKHGDWRKEAETKILALQADNKRLREALKAIRDYGTDGDRSTNGYPAEVAYDEFAYRRMVDSYWDAAKQVLEDTKRAKAKY